VHAELDAGSYPDGVKVSDEQMARVPLKRHGWHGDWEENQIIQGECGQLSLPRPGMVPVGSIASAVTTSRDAPAARSPSRLHDRGCCPLYVRA
jgi:hypothetical protein